MHYCEGYFKLSKNIPPVQQNSEQMLEVELNVKNSRVVLCCAFDVWRKVKVEKLVLHLRV